MNYKKNNLKVTPIKLMQELENAEKSLVKQEHVYHVEISSKSKRQSKGGKNNKKKGVDLVTKPITMKKLKGKCFKCKQKDH